MDLAAVLSLTLTPAVVNPGKTLTAKLAITGGTEVQGVLLQLRAREQGKTDWPYLIASETVDVPASGNLEHTFLPITVPADAVLGKYEFMCTASKDSVSQDSNIFTVTITAAPTGNLIPLLILCAIGAFVVFGRR